ncbi:hypothetical protein F183_A28960 [Bryobacterales bacterium F-183]|nr:hypothetical protein F183_A28960 [Bryobacterales bacterium F-183]
MTSVAAFVSQSAAAQQACLFPCTAGQRAFWLMDQFKQGRGSGNIPLRFQLNGPLDSGALEQAFRLLIERHEALRTAIHEMDDEPHQLIAASAPFALRIEDLQGAEASTLERRAKEEGAHPFDLSVAPLMRGVLLRCGPQRHILLLTLHHIISDGWSAGVLWKELVKAYGAVTDGADPGFAPMQLQFGDYAVWEQEMERSGAFDEDIQYWKGQLADPPQVELPVETNVDLAPGLRAEIVSRVISRDTSDALLAWSHSEGHTLFVTFLSCFQLVLRQWLNQDELVISTLVANRRNTDVEPVVGLFVNTLLLRTRLGVDLTLSEAVRRTGETVIDAIAHQAVPFDILVQRLNIRRTKHLQPYTPVNFIYQTAFLKTFEQQSTKFVPIPSVSGGPIYALNCFCVERASEGWRISIEYDAGLFMRGTVESLLSKLLASLEELRRNPVALLPRLTSQTEAPQTLTAVHPEHFVEPASNIERQLASIWEDVLDQRPISARVSFFDLGGHSLQAARIVARTNKTFGVDLRLAKLFQAPTIAEMATLLEEVQQPPQTELARMGTVVPIRPGGSKPCLFVIHGAGGHVLGFEPLVRRITAGIPVFGVESAGIDLTVDPYQTVEAMVDQHLADILAVRPHGPYRLLGYSFGGVIAYEIAQRLRAMGKRVSMLGMVDTFQPTFHPHAYDTVIHPGRLPQHVKRLFRVPDPVGYAKVAVESFLGRLEPWMFRLRRKLGLGLPRTLDALVWQNVEAGSRYVPKPYGGRITLFRASRRIGGDGLDDSLGWGALPQGGMSVIHLPGTHFDMLSEPNVEEFARLLSECLAKDAD